LLIVTRANHGVVTAGGAADIGSSFRLAELLLAGLRAGSSN
jgi:hypothetical protein